ncbi:MAG: DUF2244 domain-containing protein [Acidiphilium sp.]
MMEHIAEPGLGGPDIKLFQAVLRPYRSMGWRGMGILCGVLVAASVLVNSLMFILGAFPVIGFNGGELILALTMFWLNMRAARASEVIVLTQDHLTVTWTDPRGRRNRVEMGTAWLTAMLEERRGSVPVLTVGGRQQRVTVGAHLGDFEKRELAQELQAALARLRSPRFDNVQTRD